MPSSQKLKNNKSSKWSYSFSWSNFLFLPFLLLATLFWLSTKLSTDLQYNKEVHLDYVLDDNTILKDKLPEKVFAKLAAKGWDLVFVENFGQNNPFQLNINADMVFLDKQDLISQLNIAMAEYNVVVKDINFSSRALNLEEKTSKKLPVIFNGDLAFQSFYKLKNPVSFSPDSVTVTGPVSEFETLHFIRTKAQTLENLDKDISLTVDLEMPGKHYLSLTPLQVDMSIKTEQLTQKSLFIPVQIANRKLNSFNIVPQEIKISFLIGLSEFSYINESDFLAQIILPDDIIANQQYAVSIVKKPSNAIIQELTPAYVDVFFDN